MNGLLLVLVGVLWFGTLILDDVKRGKELSKALREWAAELPSRTAEGEET